MPRKKGDGLGRLGGRAKGTPNAVNKPLKDLLHKHSIEYFEQNLPAMDIDGTPIGGLESQFQRDCREMKPNERASLQIAILPYHTPKIQTISADISVDTTQQSIYARLKELSQIPGEEDTL